MESKDLIVVGRDDKEIIRFLRALIRAGSVTVELESQRFRLTLKPEKISGNARSVIGRGPVLDE
ncbi:MAG: hypothetical protein KJ947_04425 [Alphaproteobacteria bacterium]|nr:hypothetical protein [Alphaproteobacteria bacterium]MBU1548810.1 hypothetical protein [Alphaproteobacteria bacterium]MBU2335636.1 hypothetical protein [Alphaproteobacteria bacterium]MBU2390969.1 hypothetical protein [Alphaproteobacteria bacterium]|tara:strand:- start:404 stop:595 length:192 start_codon:yes stop_codon:yes gene_type:complete